MENEQIIVTAPDTIKQGIMHFGNAAPIPPPEEEKPKWNKYFPLSKLMPSLSTWEVED